MANNNFQPQPRVKTILDSDKLSLSTQAPEGKGYSKMFWTVTSTGNPHLVVYTNVPNDRDNGKIEAKLNLVSYYQLVLLLKEVITGPSTKDGKPFGYVMENKNFRWFGKEKSKDVEVLTKIVIGKDEDGKVFISLLSADKDRPKIKFEFGKREWHDFMYRDGTPLSAGDVSQMHAMTWVEMVPNIITTMCTNNYKHPEPKNKDGGGGGGYNRGGGSGGGGYSRDNDADQTSSRAAEDDDFPF